MAFIAKVVCILVAFMVVAAPATEVATLCGEATLDLMYCLSYLMGGPGPNTACCRGVKLLNLIAKTPQDQQVVCNCLKRYAGSIPDLVDANAAALPGKCGVSIPYHISPKTNC